MLKLKVQYFGHLMGKADSPDAGRDLSQEEKGITEDEMVGQHHQCNEHEFEQTPGNDDGQGRLEYCIFGFTKSWTRLSEQQQTTLSWLL